MKSTVNYFKKFMKLSFYTIGLFTLLFSCSPSRKTMEHTEGNISLKIMSYNILADFKGQSWKKRKEAVAKIMAESNADIIGVQEATELQLATLQLDLKKYYCYVGDRSDGHKNNQKWYEYGPIFYNKDRFNLLAKSSFWIADDPTRPGGIPLGSTSHGRTMSWLKLQDKGTQQILFVFNAHTHPPKKDLAAIKLIQNKIKTIALGQPTILLGDFNLQPNSEAYALLTTRSKNKNSHFIDAFVSAEKRTGPIATHQKGVRIDYILLRGAFHIDSYHVNTQKTATGGAPSDHSPILINTNLKISQ